jgi:hypothetical protein
VIACYYNGKRYLVLDASKYEFVKSRGKGGVIEGLPSLDYIDGVVKSQINFFNEEDRNHMLGKLDWYEEHGNKLFWS